MKLLMRIQTTDCFQKCLFPDAIIVNTANVCDDQKKVLK